MPTAVDTETAVLERVNFWDQRSKMKISSLARVVMILRPIVNLKEADGLLSRDYYSFYMNEESICKLRKLKCNSF